MRRRRSGEDYYHPNDGDGVDGTDKSKGTSTAGVDGSGSSSTGNKDSRYRVNRRAKRETNSENTGSYKTTGTGRGSKGSSSSTKTLTNSLRTEDIPVGQWIVLISLLVGIFGYVRQCNKNTGTKKTEKLSPATTRKKKEKKKSNIHRNHSSMNGRRKGKGHHSNNTHKSKAVTKRIDSKIEAVDTTNSQDDTIEPTETEHQKPVEEPPVVDNTATEIPESNNAPSEPLPTRKKKKRVKKKQVKQPLPTNIPDVTEDVLIPSSKSSPDSVSTDGSSTTANISHQDRSDDHHSVNEEFNQSFSHDYEDYADFEVQTPEEEWTTVPTRSSKTLTSSHDDSEKHEEEAVVTNTPEVNVESSSSVVSKNVSQPQDKVEISKSEEKESTPTPEVVEDADTIHTPLTTEDSNTAKPECEASTETSYESDVTPQTNNHTNNKSDCTENNSIDNDQNSHEIDHEEELNVITSLENAEEGKEDVYKDDDDDENKVVDTSSFSQEDDEALARMLQKEEEEMAAAADVQYELSAVVSPKGRPEGNDVWEEVKKKRTRKQQA